MPQLLGISVQNAKMPKKVEKSGRVAEDFPCWFHSKILIPSLFWYYWLGFRVGLGFFPKRLDIFWQIDAKNHCFHAGSHTLFTRIAGFHDIISRISLLDLFEKHDFLTKMIF